MDNPFVVTEQFFISARLRKLFMEFRRLHIPLPIMIRVTQKDYEQLRTELEIMVRHTDQTEHEAQFIVYHNVAIRPMTEE